jgi:hypothetical protein
MKDHDNQFYAESVETEIDKLLQIQAQTEITEQKQVPLIRVLHEQYMDDPEILDRAWKRITQRIKGREQQTVLDMPIPIQDYQIAKGNRHMQDHIILRNDDKGKKSWKRLSAIGSGLVAALLIASVIMIFIYHQQSLLSHPSQTASHQQQTQSTTPQMQAPGTKVPGPAASKITIKQMGTATQSVTSKGQQTTLTPTENYIFQTGQRISVSYASQPWQNTNGNNTFKWYANDTFYMQEKPELISPSFEPQKGTSSTYMNNPSAMYTQGIVYNSPGSDKVEIYWGDQLAWTIYFTVK